MDWQGIGLTEQVVEWLDETGRAGVTRERRLDPFATSMRDFDDVSANLAHVARGAPIAHNDVTQRVADLRAAGLVSTPDGVVGLTELGAVVLDAWAGWGVANDEKQDELVRMLLVYGHARRLGVGPYPEYWAYWSELRAAFNQLELINRWDRLFTLNYLDHRLNGFAPGDAYRDERSHASELDYDLDGFADAVGAGDRARKGALQVRRGISNKVPRGRARATACMAMELLLQDGAGRERLLALFGTPRVPDAWLPFNDARRALAMNVANSFGTPAARARPARRRAEAPPITVEPTPSYDDALRPAPRRRAAGGGGGRRGPRKIDHRRRQERNSEVGRLGELFALGFERWRLRDRPELAALVEHVSLDDDTLGYDIRSFETDGRDRLVEVKSTEGPLSTRFFLSAGEYACAEANEDAYVILRVADLRSAPVCCELRWPFDDVELRTATYECGFLSEDD